MKAEELYNKLKAVQEKQGYYFNNDQAIVLDLLTQLLAIKDNYGYMACPCRLSTGQREKDKDINCPCTYREADVKEFGGCYCGLYVNEKINAGKEKRQAIPERRPIEKFLA